MEIVFEFLFEIFMNGYMCVLKSRRIPLLVRLIMLVILCGALIAVAVLVGIFALKNTGVTGAVISWLIALGITALCLFLCFKII